MHSNPRGGGGGLGHMGGPNPVTGPPAIGGGSGGSFLNSIVDKYASNHMSAATANFKRQTNGQSSLFKTNRNEKPLPALKNNLSPNGYQADASPGGSQRHPPSYMYDGRTR